MRKHLKEQPRQGAEMEGGGGTTFQTWSCRAIDGPAAVLLLLFEPNLLVVMIRDGYSDSSSKRSSNETASRADS